MAPTMDPTLALSTDLSSTSTYNIANQTTAYNLSSTFDPSTTTATPYDYEFDCYSEDTSAAPAIYSCLFLLLLLLFIRLM